MGWGILVELLGTFAVSLSARPQILQKSLFRSELRVVWEKGGGGGGGSARNGDADRQIGDVSID